MDVTTGETLPMRMLAMQKFLLKDYVGYIDDNKLLTEADLNNIKNGALIVAGKVQEAEVLNHNNRIYTKETLVREVENYLKLIKTRRAIGECDHPDRPIIEWKYVSHLFTDMWWEGNKVYAKIEILNDDRCPHGQILALMHERKIPIGWSSRGLGSVEKIRGKNYVSDDYQIICWDSVTDPSTPGAFSDRTLSENDLKQFRAFDDIRHQTDTTSISLLEEILTKKYPSKTSIDFNWRF